MRPFALMLVLGAFLAAPLLAQEPATATATPAENRHVTRELPLGTADLTQAEAMILQTKSEGGSHTILKVKRTVLVTDAPENIEAMRAMLGALSQQAATNVRIDITVHSQGQSRASGVSVGGRIISGSKGSVNINPFDQKTGTNSITSQFILVGNGRAGVIEVVREVPMVDFFMGYSPGRGFVLPTTHWEKAGTQLLVKPVVTGDLITVEVTPRISQVVFANEDVFARKPLGQPLTGADQYITYTQLTSTITVQNGGTITIGGFENATDEFNRYFFGGSRATGQTVGTITLKATIQ